MKNKIRVGVIFGGRSGEHEVSLVSASSVISALDKDKYEPVLIGITKDGRWLSSTETLKLFKSNEIALDDKNEKYLLPDPGKKGLVAFDDNGNISESEKIDVIFPIMHGTYGEDGTIQGLLELANVAYVGAGVLASAVGMDKVVQKNLFIQANLPVADFLYFTLERFEADIEGWIEKIEVKLGYPSFVKPANSGSSVGISKAHNREELLLAIKEAFQYDRKVLVEVGIENAREIECAVLGGDFPEVSVPGEVVSSNEFYDYDAKYVDGKSEAIIPAPLSDSLTKEVRQLAKEAFIMLDCFGMARVDFFVSRDDNKIILNEINTIPGFTKISMFPKLWEATGIEYSVLIDKLIQLAITRHKEKNTLKTTYNPKKAWYKNGEK
jgi:D-alanine-D-alanine ligase